MIKVLFICHGNICRSPMAEFVLKDMVIRRGMQEQFYIASAATSMEEIGNGVHYGTRRILAEHGISCAGKTAVRLERRDYQEYDYLIAMEQYNIRNMLRILGDDPDHKIFRLLDFTDNPRDIDDPWYTGNFELTYREILEGCEALLRQICEKADKKGFHKLYLDGIMGLVVGDALGVPVEFTYREELKKSPVVGMMGYGTYPMPEGSWSDDSSMALATLSALHDGYDLKRIMDNFVAWEQEGAFTPTGILFDEGNTCRMAIRNYMNEGNISTCGLSGENSNGNGSLMRILPVCLYSYYLQKECAVTDEGAINLVHNVSALTHAHVRSKMACGLYYFCVKAIADRKGNVQECLQTGIDAGFEFYGENGQCSAELKHFSRIRDTETFRQIPDTEIRSGGYVIESIEAAIWCLLTTDNYRDCVLKAVNLGYDTDTTAAIAGGLAGLYYGYDNIPAKWKAAIIRRDWIEEMCNALKVMLQIQ